MSRDKRIELIRELEAIRGSRLLAIVLGDRPNAETRIAADQLQLIGRHLREIGKTKRLDVLLYSLGGDVMTGYRIVGLLREYADHVAVLVPFKCQSTATLIALGANEIVMLPPGQLSPVDPSTNSPYNPIVQGAAVVPGQPPPFLPVNVEDVVAYFHLAREEAGIEGNDAVKAMFLRLAEDVRPLALGQVYRARTQIRMLARNLLNGHFGADSTATVDSIVETLTHKLYSHDYLISRREAREIGLPVSDPSDGLERVLVELYEQYEAELQLHTPYLPPAAMNQQSPVEQSVDRAILESASRLDVYCSKKRYLASPQGLLEQLVEEGWQQR